MKTVFITIARGSLIRNFFHTGIVSGLLARGIRVVVLTPYHNNPDLFQNYRHANLIIEKHAGPGVIRWRRIMEELLRGAIFNRTVWFLARSRILGKSPNKLWLIPRLLFIAPLRFFPGFVSFIRWFDAKLNPQAEQDYLFSKYAPDLVFVTSANGYTDSGITKGARRFGVPTVGMPKSWDNLSKMLFNAVTDYLLVWSEFMRRQAVRYQRYGGDKIWITGIPQFDIYAQKEHLLSREEFCRQFNFDPNRKIILYGSSGGGHDIGMEADYPEMIQEWLNNGQLRNLQVLVRPHLGYKDDADKFQRLAQYPQIVIDKTDKQDHSMRDHWDPSFDHLKHLYNSLYHADVCVNIASTLTLDAVACDTPVINIKFDKNPKVRFDDSARRLYESDYIAALMQAGGSWIAESRESFLEALKAILERGEKKNTQNIVDYFLYKSDGQSAERIVDKLVEIVNKAMPTKLQNYSIKELRAKTQKLPGEVIEASVGIIVRFFSVFLTWFFIRTKVTPNQLTVLGTVMYLVGVSLFAFNEYSLTVAAWFLMFAATLVDASDGEIHRFRGYKGGYGASYVEPLSHDIMYGLMFIPVGYGVYLKTGNPLFLLLGPVTSIFKILFRITQMRFFYGVTQLLPAKGHTDDTKNLVEHSGPAKMLYYFYRNLGTSGGILVFSFLAVVFNKMEVFLVAYAIIFFLLWFGLLGRQLIRFSKISKQITNPGKNFTSVVLAAGIGSRLGSLTANTPKPLIKVGERSLIDYAIAWLKHLGSRRIIVVGGYMFEAIKKHINDFHPDAVVVENKEYVNTHRMVSLARARDYIRGDLLIQDGDYIYHSDIKEIIDRTNCAEITVFASRQRSQYTEQDVIALTDENGRLLEIYKTAGTQELGPDDYYFNSLVYLPEARIGNFFAIADQMIAAQGGLIQVEDVLLEYAKRGNVVKVVDAGEPLWVEVDNPTELEAAQRFIAEHNKKII